MALCEFPLVFKLQNREGKQSLLIALDYPLGRLGTCLGGSPNSGGAELLKATPLSLHDWAEREQPRQFSMQQAATLQIAPIPLCMIAGSQRERERDVGTLQWSSLLCSIKKSLVCSLPSQSHDLMGREPSFPSQSAHISLCLTPWSCRTEWGALQYISRAPPLLR